MNTWNIDSWKEKLAIQIPHYPSIEELKSTVALLSESPPISTPFEIEELQLLLAEVSEGKRFLLQSGDCAESFSDCSYDITFKKANHLLHMGDIIEKNLNLPVTLVGRMAGQYAKPRSSEYELHEGQSLLSYRGDMVNEPQKNLIARIPKPELMLKAYKCSFMIASQLASFSKNLLNTLYTSHEALILHYEQALTRYHSGKWYILSTHFPWLGMRTAISSPAHVEYLRGISNPIGIKIGPAMEVTKLLEILKILDPQKTPGKIMLIYRLGASISKFLPLIIDAVKKSHRKVVWCCDPMHGNTEILADGIKTRRIENIKNELEQAIIIHKTSDTFFGGIHLEATHEYVKECMYNFEEPEKTDTKYTSLLDPRLNSGQSFEIIKFVVEEIKKHTAEYFNSF